MFQVLHSSAGAGKTHALVKYYLTNCLKGEDPGAYRQVLALTFTNKAAAEMKERVIGYLEQLAEGAFTAGPMPDLVQHIKEISGIDDATLVQRSQAVLGHMLHHWSDVAISTIDSFTRRVVRPFARDLRLDHDLRMTTEQEYYQDRAVEALIEEAGNDTRITELLTQACMQLLHEERSWDPSKPLKELSKELVKESAIEPLANLRARSMEDLLPLRERLNRETALFRQRVNSIGTKALELFSANGIDESDVAHGKNGILSYFRKLEAFTDVWEAPGPQASKPIETGKWHSGKASATAISALEGIASEVTGLFNEAEDLRANELPQFQIKRAVARELLPAFALHELDVKLEALKHEDGVAFFSDLTRRVAEVVKNEPVPFIYERIGEKYKHFLIDEFQDTSLLQWNALLPLIENALSVNGSALLVGDAKQAIYRWRNGEVRLFVDLPKVFGRADDIVEQQREATLERNFMEGERLAHNRRSAQRIIAFNNSLFGALPILLPENLRKVYDKHEQRTSHTDLGLVRMDIGEPGSSGEDLVMAINKYTLKYVEEALADGFSLGDIAVLSRSKRVGRKVSRYLLEQGHAVISPEGLQLAADPVVQLLIEHLRFVHTGEKTAAARVMQLQAKLNGTRQENGEVDTATELFEGSDVLPDPIAHVRAWLKTHGTPRLRTTVAALVTELGRACGAKPAEDPALLTLLDEIHSWTMEHAQDIGGFLEHWERRGGERSTAAPGEGHAIQVMTVHGSKGLQFPVVIIPDARMGGSKKHGELFWIDPGAAIPELDSALIREGKAIREVGLDELTTEDGLRLLDSMDLLYVAFTRPEQRLYAFVPDHHGDEISKALIAHANANPELSTATIDAKGPRHARSTSSTEPLIDVMSEHGSPTPTIRFEAPEEWDPAKPEARGSYGTVVHDVIANTRTASDLAQALDRAVDIGDLTTEQAANLLTELGERISSEDLAPWFSAELDVRAEATLITADGNALRPDRLVIERDRTRLLEIKTGSPSKTHEDQVHSYLSLLRELGHSNVSGAIWYLGNGEVRPIA